MNTSFIRTALAGTAVLLLAAAALGGVAGTAAAAEAPATARAAVVIAGPTPTISGTVKVGSTLTASAGTWTPAPVALAYQWKRGGTAIAGATSLTYRPVSADAGVSLTVSVTGSKPGSTALTTTSAATGKVGRGTLTTAAPVIVGTVILNSTLSVTTGSWTPAPVTFSYHWKREGIALPGATGATYAVTPDDIGKHITVTVDGNRPGYLMAVRTSLPAKSGR